MIGLVSKKYPKLRRGAYTKAVTLSSLFPDYFKSLEIASVPSVSTARDSYTKLVFFTQTPFMYKTKYNQALQHKNDLVFIRPEYNLAWFNSTTNGFSVYKETNIKQFHPIVVSDQYNCLKKDTLVVGVYFRPDIVSDSFDMLVRFLAKQKVHLVVMGSHLGINHPNILSYKHTNNPKEFFSSITHYYMPMSTKARDPWPNTLVEAVNSGAQIIIDRVNRPFKDGIDDIMSCIEYHTELTNTYYNNQESVLMMSNWLAYYQYLAVNNFEYRTREYKTSRDWGENELSNF